MMVRFFAVSLIMPALLLAGCAGSVDCAGGTCFYGPSDQQGAVSFALSGSDTNVRSFIIKLYKGATERARDNAYFQSSCSPLSKGFTISHVDVGDDYVVEYLGYSDGACTPTTLVKQGVRGGVRITTLGTGFSYYFIQVNTVGDFTAMPTPDQTLNPGTGGVSCLSDSDCRAVIPCPDPSKCRFKVNVDCTSAEIDAGECPDGVKVMQYNVHPRAVCDVDTCRLKTLFPLNTRGNRAFASTVRTGSGDVVSFGGFTGKRDGFYVVEGASDRASAPETQLFSGDSGIFGVLEHDKPLDSGVGMSSSVLLDDGRFVVVGGTSKALAASGSDFVGAPELESIFCTSDCPVQMSSYLYVIDSQTGEVDRTQLAEAVMPAAVLQVARPTPSVYVRAAASMKDFAGDRASGASTISWLCQVSDSNAVSCSDVGPSNPVSRFMPASVCIKRSAGLCSELLTLGGTDNISKFAEIYYADTNQVKVFPGTGDVPAYLTGAVAFMAGDRIWLVGGTDDPDSTRTARPYEVSFERDLGVVVLSEVELPLSQADALGRIHHQVTVLGDDDHVLVTGGMNQDGVVSSGAVLLKFDAGRMDVVDDSLSMTTARMGHSATLIGGGLYDGSVLITGGISTASGDFADGAEVYVPAFQGTGH